MKTKLMLKSAVLVMAMSLATACGSAEQVKDLNKSNEKDSGNDGKYAADIRW